jgi:hypothetical protein
MYCLIAILLSVPCLQDDTGMIDYFRQLMGTQFDRELKRMQDMTGLEPESLDPVTDAALPVLDKAAAKFGKDFATGWLPGVLDQSVTSQMLIAMAPIVGKAQTASYQADLAARRKYFIDTVVSGAMVHIDRCVLLTGAQARRIKVILTTQWPDAGRSRLPLVTLATLGGGFSPGFPDGPIKKTLTLAQQDAWAFHAQQMKVRVGQAPNDPDRYTVASLAKLSEHYALIIAERYELSQSATRKLVVASKGVSAAMASQRRALPKFPKTVEGRQLQEAFPADVILCLSNWHDRVRRVLNAEQDQHYLKEQDVRGLLNRDAAVQSLVCQFADSHVFTAQEQAGLVKLFIRSAPADPRGTLSVFSKTYIAMAEVNDEEVAKVLRQPQRLVTRKWFDHLQEVISGLDTGK